MQARLLLFLLCLTATTTASSSSAQPHETTSTSNPGAVPALHSYPTGTPIPTATASETATLDHQPVSATPIQTTTPTSDTPAARAAPKAAPRDYGLNTGLGAAPPSVVRDTPREALQGFLDAAQRGNFDTASHYLHLWGIDPARQKKDGPELARKLASAMERAVWIDVDRVPDTPTGTSADDSNTIDSVRIATVDVPGGTRTIRFARTRDTFSSNMVWVFSPNTVQSIDTLDDAYGLPNYANDLPPWLREPRVLGLFGFQWIGLIALGFVGWFAGFVLGRPVPWVLRRVASHTTVQVAGINGEGTQSKDHTVVLARKLLRWLTLPLAVLFFNPQLRLSATTAQQLNRYLVASIILVVMVGALRLVRILFETIQQRHGEGGDPLRIRSVITRIEAFRRVAHVIIVVVGVALALMQFPTARTVGLSLLGSAGIAGAILGFAAQKTFSNLFAGVLISFTQPVRIEDTVIVEGELGQIETIGATHAVVRVWDNRRIVIPVTYFLDQPFQNWTKVSPEMAGTVFVYADYLVDVDAIRAELDRILDSEPLFDGRVKAVLVTDVTDKAVEVRITVSASNAGDLFGLRCKVRERMLAFMRKDPKQLPHHRLQAPGL